MSRLLDGKRIIVTGVVNRHSIAYAVAEGAQREGAEVVLTSFGRVRRMTERAARNFDPTPAVLELDVDSDADLARLRESLAERWGTVDGIVHAIAFAPPDALGGDFLATPRKSALRAFETSAYSLGALCSALGPLLASRNGSGAGASVVGLDFDASVAWPAYDWMGVAKAGLEAVSRYLARDLGSKGTRVNLVSAGPVATPAAGGIPGFDRLASHWSEAAPLGWDERDAGAVADAVLFLLSDLSRAVSGEILHADGGAHAVAGSLSASPPEPSTTADRPAPAQEYPSLQRK